MSKSFRETAVKQTIERVAEGGGWLVVTSPSSDTAALIETGRQLERLWLRVRERKIAIHPMSQLLEEAPWREQVASSLSLKGTLQFVLRIGYLAEYPDPVSLRMPPTWMVQL